ncbi:hypothetical protein [Kitasatospora sp. NPDC059327]|uniref:hypothetical protein n=1 Tax=Kitasatospora sp. NPDC059327 TaxID=3346803 RepID=UPI0036D03928
MATSVETNSGVATAITAVEVQLAQLEGQRASLEAELERVAGYITSLRVALDSLCAVAASLKPAVGTTAGPAVPALLSAEEALPVAEEREPAEVASGLLPAVDEPAPRKTTRRRVPAPSAATTEVAPAKRAARKPRKTTEVTAEAAPLAESKPKARSTRKTAAKKTASPAPAAPAAAKRPRGIADGVLSALTAAGKPLRAGEVSAALGADSTDDNVRATLERLVKAGRAQRAGRGLFEVLSKS